MYKLFNLISLPRFFWGIEEVWTPYVICRECQWEMRNGKNYWKQQCVFEVWLLSYLLIAESRLENQMIHVRKSKTLITLQQEILLISLWMFKKLLQNMSNIGCSSKSLGTLQEQTQQCQHGKRQDYLQEVQKWGILEISWGKPVSRNLRYTGKNEDVQTSCVSF